MLHLAVSLRMREHRSDPRGPEPEETVADVEWPAEVRRLDQQVRGIAREREAEQLIVRPVELRQIELAARDEPERVTHRRLHFGERRFHLLGGRRIVVAHMGRRREHGDAVGKRIPADRERLAEVFSAVVETRENVAMQIDHPGP